MPRAPARTLLFPLQQRCTLCGRVCIQGRKTRARPRVAAILFLILCAVLLALPAKPCRPLSLQPLSWEWHDFLQLALCA